MSFVIGQITSSADGVTAVLLGTSTEVSNTQERDRRSSKVAGVLGKLRDSLLRSRYRKRLYQKKV